jgi:monomeric sarcosine oxidase
MEHYDAIVLGAGGVGGAALFHLARRGVKVLGIDRFNPPHDRGSTHGHTRVIRQAYFEHPDYVPLLIESYRLWRELEGLSQRNLLHQIGLIQVGPAGGVVVPGVLRSAEEHELAVEQLTAAGVEKWWPGLRASDDLVGVFEPEAGYLLVDDCVDAHLNAARAAGAKILTDTEVQTWTADDREVRVQTSRGELTAKRLVISAGAWAGQLLADLNVRLEVRRKSLFWFETKSAEYEVAADFPVFLFELPEGVFYGFPKLDARGVKIAEHTGGRVVEDPLVVDRTVDDSEKQRVTDFLVKHLPGVSQHMTDHAVCLYTMSPDEHFIVDRHPRHANVVFAAGLSGHGFKFVPVLGRALAELVLDGSPNVPIGFLSLQRFANLSL